MKNATKVLFGYHHLIVMEYNFKRIRQTLEKFIGKYQRDTWEELAQELRFIGSGRLKGIERARTLMNEAVESICRRYLKPTREEQKLSQFIASTSHAILKGFSSAVDLPRSRFDCDAVCQIAQQDDCSDWYCLTAKEATDLVDEAHEHLKKGQFEETRLGQLLIELLRAEAEVLAWWSTLTDDLDVVEADESALIEVCSSQLRCFPPELYLHVRS